MKRIYVIFLTAAILMTAQSATAKTMLENHFQCKTIEGVTFADVVAFKNEYEAAVQAAGFDGYNLKVMFPVYHSQIGGGQFTWYGSFTSNKVWADVSDWFNSSEWPARFNAIVSCESSSLWRVDD